MRDVEARPMAKVFFTDVGTLMVAGTLPLRAQLLTWTAPRLATEARRYPHGRRHPSSPSPAPHLDGPRPRDRGREQQQRRLLLIWERKSPGSRVNLHAWLAVADSPRGALWGNASPTGAPSGRRSRTPSWSQPATRCRFRPSRGPLDVISGNLDEDFLISGDRTRITPSPSICTRHTQKYPSSVKSSYKNALLCRYRPSTSHAI
ncbi:hypothetical protein TRIUR3_20110 [Triticum urartu]|uniref:Uncharacterized protein n=1 Tax=Triticum urartu TaxID=4572 RepID=M7ZWJ3_TRIUA|nr:hypothetical protein TRIUR3_20110 [Triticum urartu]